MADLLIRILINALALVLVIQLVPGVGFIGGWPELIAIAAVFGIINAYLRPILRLLSLPVSLVSLGLVGFAINTGLLLLLAVVGEQLGLRLLFAGWPIQPFSADALVMAFLASLVVSAVSTIVGLVRLITPGV